MSKDPPPVFILDTKRIDEGTDEKDQILLCSLGPIPLILRYVSET